MATDTNPMTTKDAALRQAREALKDALDEYDRNVCTHETTHRGGFLWTICDDCGSKWADDRGGFKPYSDPPRIVSARAALTSIDAALAGEGAAGDVREPGALLPCPFCGGDARIVEGQERFFVSCNNCFCCVGEAYDHSAYPEHLYFNQEDAAEAWNKRAVLAAIPTPAVVRPEGVSGDPSDPTTDLLGMLRAAFPNHDIPVEIIATQSSGYHVFPEEFARMAEWSNASRDAAVAEQAEMDHVIIRRREEAIKARDAQIAQLREDNHILASAVMGWTPDHNTQTPERVAETEAVIEGALNRALPQTIEGARVRDCQGREYSCGYDDRRGAEMRRLREALEPFVTFGKTEDGEPPTHPPLDAAVTRAVTELDLLRQRMAGQAIPIDIVASLGAIVLGLRQAVEGGR